MKPICQGRSGLLAILATLGVVASGVSAAAAAGEPRPSVEFRPWAGDSLAAVALTDPELAACLVASPNWWEVAAPAAALPATEPLAQAISERLVAALGSAAPSNLTAYLAATPEGAPAAVARHRVVLALLPDAPPPSVVAVAQTVAQAVVASRLLPAAPDPRCSEPFLALAEAMVQTGITTLATLPANLRPLADWVDDEAVARGLEEEVTAVLDGRKPWADRRVRLAQLGRPGTAPPAFAQAAARVLEAAGEPARFLPRPLELLLAWRDGKGEQWPRMPRTLRRALGDAARAGLPRTPSEEERRALALAALERAVAAGEYPAALADPSTPLAPRLAAAARRRAEGGGAVCPWFRAEELPPGVVSGCREAAETGGVLFARPAFGGAFEILSRSPAGNEVPVLRWPRWALFATVLAGGDELALVDSEGVWTVALDASHPPRRIAQGSFRHLAASPSGRRLAAVAWPGGGVVLLDTPPKALPVDGRGGLGWLTDDVLVASDGSTLRLATPTGEVRDTGLLLPHTTSLAVRGGVVLAVAGAAPDVALVAVSLTEGGAVRRLAAVPPTLGLATLEDGTVMGGGPTLWSFREGGMVETAGVGLTPTRAR